MFLIGVKQRLHTLTFVQKPHRTKLEHVQLTQETPSILHQLLHQFAGLVLYRKDKMMSCEMFIQK